MSGPSSQVRNISKKEFEKMKIERSRTTIQLEVFKNLSPRHRKSVENVTEVFLYILIAELVMS